jgi:hypothetical protein
MTLADLVILGLSIFLALGISGIWDQRYRKGEWDD